MENKKTFKLYTDLPKLSPLGFKVVKCPEETWQIIQDAYNRLKGSIQEEKFVGKDTYIPGVGNTSDIMSLDSLPEVIALIHKQLLPIHEDFCKTGIAPKYIYGIRSYNKGARLTMHRDRIETHHIASIIVVDKDLGGAEDWPLDIQAHDGTYHKVYANAGDIILYESAACEHGRKEVFQGNYFRSMFVHYEFTDLKYE